jgi:hypothetical protein
VRPSEHVLVGLEVDASRLLRRYRDDAAPDEHWVAAQPPEPAAKRGVTHAAPSDLVVSTKCNDAIAKALGELAKCGVPVHCHLKPRAVGTTVCNTRWATVELLIDATVRYQVRCDAGMTEQALPNPWGLMATLRQQLVVRSSLRLLHGALSLACGRGVSVALPPLASMAQEGPCPTVPVPVPEARSRLPRHVSVRRMAEHEGLEEAMLRSCLPSAPHLHGVMLW